ncbi:S8 family peptidase [Chloroflexota bacterium]
MNTNKVKGLRYLLVAVLLVVMLAVPANLALAEPDMVNVLVSFNQPPGSSEWGLINSLGGEVTSTYHIVPVVAATIPSVRLSSLSANPNVNIVEEDVTIFSSTTGEILPWGVDRIDAELVHPTNKGTGIKVAILDTGIDLDHPDLNVAGDVTFVPGTTTGDDDNGHGTLVAGIVGALDNEIGVIGVAPEAAIYSIKVLNANGDGVMSVILSGIEWAVDNDMQVMNIGAGSMMNWPSAIVTALANAYNGGMVIFAGAGNGGAPDGQGENIWAPARYAAVIAVGATDQSDNRLSSSSTGATLELMAPGDTIPSTAMGGGYGSLSLTSAAAPHAVGTAALLFAAGRPGDGYIRQAIRDSAEDLGDTGWDSQYGWGLVDAPEAIITVPVDTTSPVTTILLSGTAGDNGWYVSDVEVTLSATDVGGTGVAGTEYSLDGGQIWNPYTVPFTITTDGNNQVLARSWDNISNLEEPPAAEAVNIDRAAPVLTETAIPAEIARINKNESVPVDYSGTAEDPTSGIYTTNTVLIDEYGELDQDLGASLSGTVSVEAWCDGNDKEGRTYTFRLTVSDVAGNEASVEAIVTILHP